MLLGEYARHLCVLSRAFTEGRWNIHAVDGTALLGDAQVKGAAPVLWIKT